MGYGQCAAKFHECEMAPKIVSAKTFLLPDQLLLRFIDSKLHESKTAANLVFYGRSISLTSTKTIVYACSLNGGPPMRMRTRVAWGMAMLTVIVSLNAQAPSSPEAAADDSQVRPPVTEADLQIVKQAR